MKWVLSDCSWSHDTLGPNVVCCQAEKAASMREALGGAATGQGSSNNNKNSNNTNTNGGGGEDVKKGNRSVTWKNGLPVIEECEVVGDGMAAAAVSNTQNTNTPYNPFSFNTTNPGTGPNAIGIDANINTPLKSPIIDSSQNSQPEKTIERKKRHIALAVTPEKDENKETEETESLFSAKKTFPICARLLGRNQEAMEMVELKVSVPKSVSLLIRAKTEGGTMESTLVPIHKNDVLKFQELVDKEYSDGPNKKYNLKMVGEKLRKEKEEEERKKKEENDEKAKQSKMFSLFTPQNESKTNTNTILKNNDTFSTNKNTLTLEAAFTAAAHGRIRSSIENDARNELELGLANTEPPAKRGRETVAAATEVSDASLAKIREFVSEKLEALKDAEVDDLGVAMIDSFNEKTWRSSVTNTRTRQAYAQIKEQIIMFSEVTENCLTIIQDFVKLPDEEKKAFVEKSIESLKITDGHIERDNTKKSKDTIRDIIAIVGMHRCIL